MAKWANGRTSQIIVIPFAASFAKSSFAKVQKVKEKAKDILSLHCMVLIATSFVNLGVSELLSENVSRLFHNKLA